jgi:hypothetical protein
VDSIWQVKAGNKKFKPAQAAEDFARLRTEQKIAQAACHGSSLDLTLGHVTIDIRVEGAILVHSEEAILMHSEGTIDILGRSHPLFTRPILG